MRRTLRLAAAALVAGAAWLALFSRGARPQADSSFLSNFPIFELVRVAGAGAIGGMTESASATTRRSFGADHFSRRDEFDCAIGVPGRPALVDSSFLHGLERVIVIQARGGGARVIEVVSGDSSFRCAWDRGRRTRGAILVTGGRRGPDRYSLRFAMSMTVAY